MKKGRIHNREIVTNEVNEIVDKIIPTSTTNKIIDMLINKSVWEGRFGGT